MSQTGTQSVLLGRRSTIRTHDYRKPKHEAKFLEIILRFSYSARQVRARLFSRDELIQWHCREALRQCGTVNWEFGISEYDASGPLPEAELYIWDFVPDMDLTARPELAADREHIFILDRKDLALLRRQLEPAVPSRVLLKPMNAVLLHSYVAELAAGTSTQCLEQDLFEANLQLQQCEHDRSRFLAYSLHEFRAPLGAFDGYCGLLLDRRLGPLTSEQVKAIERMQQSVKRLSRLAASMMQLSGGDQIRMDLRMNPDDIEECIGQAVEEVRPIADARKLQLIVQTTPAVDMFFFDRTQIGQLLGNLLDRACRYTPKGGQVTIQGYPVFWDRRVPNLTELRPHSERRSGYSNRPNAYHIELRDSGSGIPRESPERVLYEFPPFDGQNGEVQTGLSLAACRQIIGLHGGRIFAESTGDSNRFVVVLPFAYGARRAAARNSKEPKKPTSQVAG